MIIRIKDMDALRTMRLKLYKDPVFLIGHEKIRPLLQSLDLTELFASAEAFASHLAKYAITEESLMQYEVDDIKGELPDAPTDYYLLLCVTFFKLCAMRKTHPSAADAARALVSFCSEYDGFTHLMHSMEDKETLLRAQHRLPSLLEYELTTLSQERLPLEQAKDFIHKFVDNCMALSPGSIEKILLPLMATNEQYGNAFDEEVNRLKQKLGMKTSPPIQPLVQGDFVMEKKVENEVNVVGKDSIGVIIKDIKDIKEK